MDKQLEDFKSTWDNRDTRPQAKGLATAYVNSHKAEMEVLFKDLTLEQIVAQVDFYRSQGRAEDVIKADMWLLANFEPQKIVGTYGPPPRRVRN